MPQAPSKTPTPLSRLFGNGGWLARNHPQFEFRQSQLDMAEEVESALEHGRHLIVEAGTGTGKTLAYLAPILRIGRRVVISTGTKNLQEQLFYKDIPFLQKLAPGLRATLMKGRGNYLCRQKLYDVQRQPALLDGMDDVERYTSIREWEALTETGDRAELEDLPDSSGFWGSIDARRETCTGQKCPQFERCFITLMRQRAAESNLIVVNHHLFFADLAVRQSEYGGLLPEYDAVVFDEAHEIEDVATKYFGLQVSSFRIEELVRDAERAAKKTEVEASEVFGAAAELRHRAGLFFENFPAQEGRFSFENRAEFLEHSRGAYSSLTNSLLRLGVELGRIKDHPEELMNLARRAEELRLTCESVFEGKERNRVYWWERRGRSVFVEATPIDVSGILRERVFDRVDSVILTSATLAVSGSFSFLKTRLGVQNAREKVLESHFDFASQAVLYLPAHLPDPREPDFQRQAASEIVQILKATRGRAFVLFTSYAQMRDIFERVRPQLRYTMMIQGTAPAPVLLNRFREAAHPVLFATSSFWQGVDVQGQQLSAVIIDRLPFAVPTDPVVAARIQQIKDEGGNAFAEYQIPEAVIALKQGFGRLIRSQSDHGVLALLDNRMVRKAYGKVFFESLPPYHRTNKLDEVKSFMQKY